MQMLESVRDIVWPSWQRRRYCRGEEERGVRIGEGRGRRGEGGGERHNLVVLVRAGIGGTARG